MVTSKSTDFCTECRKETEYILKKTAISKRIRDKEYSFEITTAVCSECGEEMSLPGLIDKNIHEIDEQYRNAEGIVTIEDIEKLMQLYNIGKAPLSLALGFGEITISRYLEGQIPSKEYSDVIKSALLSPSYMKQKLSENKEKLTDAAYKKALTAADNISRIFSISENMLLSIAYIFKKLDEVTPLSLQKLLYFTQGIYSALYKVPLFCEDCQAWVHGPVYPEVYDLFRDFRYNPIDDARFALFEMTDGALNDEAKIVIDLIINTFGMYGGKMLERVTHKETPWIDARKGYDNSIPSNEIIPKNKIMQYYIDVNQKYDIHSESGLMDYIHAMLDKS